MHALMPYMVIHVVVFAVRRCTAQEAVTEAMVATIHQGFIQDFYNNRGTTMFLNTKETDLMVLWTIWNQTQVPQPE